MAMASGGSDKGKGFDGFNSLVSDLSDLSVPKSTPKPVLGAITPEPSAHGSPAPAESGADPRPEPQKIEPPRPAGNSGGKWALGVLAVVVVVWVASSLTPSTVSPPSQPISLPPLVVPTEPTVHVPPASDAPMVLREEIPQVGTDNVLTANQIRYCLSQEIRLSAANAVVDARSQSDINRFNLLIADYNSRCSQYRYPVDTFERVRAEVEGRRMALEAEGTAAFGPSAASQPEPMPSLPQAAGSNSGIPLADARPQLPPASAPIVQAQRVEWIQILSRPTAALATELATHYRLQFDNTVVFRYENGWFVVVLGPYEGDYATSERDRLVASGAIPSDSFVVDGTRFADRVDDPVPKLSQPSTATAPNPSIQAVEAAEAFQKSWSLPNGQALEFLDRLYAPELTYYGKRTSKEEVMREKVAFAKRWPERAYTVQPGTLTPACALDGLCTVEGVVDWNVYSPERNVTSSGSAKFDLTFSTKGPLQIVAEGGKVLSRHSYEGRVASLPTRAGECSEAVIAEIGSRLLGVPESGSAVGYTNGGYQVSYELLPGVAASRVGDHVKVCLVSIPTGCPPGDDRGRVYRATNVRTGATWEAPDSEHMCGGA